MMPRICMIDQLGLFMREQFIAFFVIWISVLIFFKILYESTIPTVACGHLKFQYENLILPWVIHNKIWKFHEVHSQEASQCLECLSPDVNQSQCSKPQTGPRFNIKMHSYQYRKSHSGDKTVVRSSYLHNGISYIGKMSSLYWIRAQKASLRHSDIIVLILQYTRTSYMHNISDISNIWKQFTDIWK